MVYNRFINALLTMNKAINYKKPFLNGALLIKINLSSGSIVILRWCSMWSDFKMYIILTVACFTNGNASATLLSKPFKQLDEWLLLSIHAGRGLGLESDWKKMSPSEEVMLDCTELDQRLMLTRAFDLTSLLQYSNILCIQIRVLPRRDPQLFSSSGFGWHW